MMNNKINELVAETAGIKEKLIVHPLYNNLDNLAHVRLFME